MPNRSIAPVSCTSEASRIVPTAIGRDPFARSKMMSAAPSGSTRIGASISVVAIVQ
jgi:hypothetical protein